MEIQSTKTNPVLIRSVQVGVLVISVLVGVVWYVGDRTLSKKVLSPVVAADVVTGDTALPIQWGDLGIRLVASGVIDRAKWDAIYAGRGGMSPDMEAMMSAKVTEPIIINAENASEMLNLLWAFGLANKNSILETGPMAQYGNPGDFASTGGWTLASGNPMSHYSQHVFVTLSNGQQQMVERMAKGIYRPCCGNSTHFPDCNHGMAMLGLLELMAASGVSEAEMYRVALRVNSLWFPDTYLTLEKYFRERQDLTWDKVNPALVLSSQYSSGGGYQRVLSEITPPDLNGGGGGCGV